MEEQKDEQTILVRKYYKDGKICLELPCNNGTIDGTVKQYYDNGNIYNTIPFIKGYPHGIAKSYEKDGEINSQVLWHEGKMQNRTVYSA